MKTRFMKLPEVMRVTALSRSSLYAFINKGTFPTPVKLGEKAVGWVEEEISDWISTRANLRTKGGRHV